jgi:hypothetical protein
VAGVAILGLAILAFLIVLLVTGGGGSDPGAASSPSPGPSAAASSAPTGVPSAPAEPTPEPTSGASLAPSEVPAIDGPRIEYEVQEGEALIAIAATFGTSRREILLANPEMAEQRPYTEPGDLIIVPVAPDMAASDVKAVPGFVRYLE